MTAWWLLVAALLAWPGGQAAARLDELAPGQVAAGSGGESTPAGPRRRGPRLGRRPRAPRADPVVGARIADLAAACLAAGMGWGRTCEAVAEALDGPVSTAVPVSARALCAAQLRALGRELDAGRSGDPDRPEVAALAEIARRDGGGAAVPALRGLARRRRAEATAEAVARAERVGVFVAGPLGLCFLPAFVCLGVVPVVLGLAADILPAVRG